MKVKKLDPRAKLPLRAHPTDSGADLFALTRTVLPAHAITKVHTGVAVELPENTSGMKIVQVHTLSDAVNWLIDRK